MTRVFVFFPLILLSALLQAQVQLLPPLPAMTYAGAVQVDASQNIYLAGRYSTSSEPNVPSHAFAAKLSPDGTQTIWFTKLAGSSNDYATALAVGADGSVYITGSTQSTDFPTTPGSMQRTQMNGQGQAFVTKLNPNGAIVYSTFVAGSSQGAAIVVDSSGDAFVTGLMGSPGFPAMSGTITANTSGFILELNPQGTAAIVAIAGFGGSRIAIDSQGFIYAASFSQGPVAPTTPGAFQSSSAQMTCASSFISVFPCAYQHIAKINPNGTQLIYATYLAGQWGAIPYGMAVDANGEVIVAGSANGADYPVTPGAYQSIYSGNPDGAFVPPFIEQGPTSAGYVTKLNATGTGLIWSSYFGGSGTTGALPGGGFTVPLGDTINSMAVDSAGNVVVGGFANSSDLPGLATTPVASRPMSTATLNGFGFIARFSADGGRISVTQLLSNQVTAIAVRSDGSTVVVAQQPALVTFPPDGRVYAIADPADNARVVNVAPGQLLTLYGTNLAPAPPAQPPNGFPTTLDGVTVTFNGIPAPILYASGIQINLQVPYEIAGQTQVTMQVSSAMVSPPVSESYILGVVARQPSVFLSASNFSGPIFGQLSCAGTTYAGVQALAYNPDGSVNSCANPAPTGSRVTIFLNGAGVTSPSLSTGSVNAFPPVAITPAASVTVPAGSSPPASVASTVAAPGSISGVLDSVLENFEAPATLVPLNFGGANVREQNILVWVKPVAFGFFK